jgi:hypothetical protein
VLSLNNPAVPEHAAAIDALAELRVTKGILECAKEVTKWLKNAQKSPFLLRGAAVMVDGTKGFTQNAAFDVSGTTVLFHSILQRCDL